MKLTEKVYDVARSSHESCYRKEFYNVLRRLDEFDRKHPNAGPPQEHFGSKPCMKPHELRERMLISGLNF